MQTPENPRHETRGSGSDANSDSRRLVNPDNYLDKVAEDTFPASDPPSHSPMTGAGRQGAGATAANDDRENPDADKEAFKKSGAAQFKYGRQSQVSTQHFDTSRNRLDHGNPDVGEIDLGNIEADRPAEPDDNDHLD